MTSAQGIRQTKVMTRGARGIFAGIDLSDAAITQDKDDTALLYGKVVPFEGVLGGKVAAPKGSEPLLTTVKKYSSQAREQGKATTPAPASTTSANTN